MSEEEIKNLERVLCLIISNNPFLKMSKEKKNLSSFVADFNTEKGFLLKTF